ncbi:MAG: hypothetical protein EOP49_15340 [Sphingobacteriales bacterium]|nr:MAG: hypothetical protein EOP49_15340 [Sphingobacteriales bacterium]
MRRTLVIASAVMISVIGVVLLYPDGEYTSPEIQAAYNNRLAQHSDVLWVRYMSCTECFDLYIDSGKMIIPQDLSQQMRGRSDRDIIVCGKFPIQNINPGNFFHDPSARYRITGKMIGIETRAAGEAPLFYVEQWERY